MRILKFYIVRELIVPSTFGILLFILLLWLNKIFIFSRLLITKKAPLLGLAELFLTQLLTTLPLAVPMGILLGALLCWTRLSQDNEITALKANAVDIKPLIGLHLIISLLISLCILVFNHKVSPYLNHHSYQIYYKLLKGEPFASLEENAFNKIGNRQIFIEKIDKKKGLLKNVYIFEDAGKFGLNERMFQVIQAKSAVLKKLTEGLFEMKLKQGMIHQFSQTNKSIYNILSFDSYTVTLNLGEGTYKKSKLEELTSLELKERISKMMGARSVIIRLKLELASRTSLPFACCIFVLLAISTALWTKRSSRSISFGLSSLFILTYYLLFMGGQFLSHKEIVSPSLGVWIPNILLGIWGIISLNKRLKA